MGDSHTYGEGSRGDYGPYAIQTHSTRYGATTWSTLLRDELHRAWRSEPTQFVSAKSSVAGRNRVTGGSPLQVTAGGKRVEVVPHNHPNHNILAQSGRFTTEEVRMMNYNTFQGYFSPLVTFASFEPDMGKMMLGIEDNTFSPLSTMSYCDPKGRFGIVKGITCIDGVLRDRAFVALPYSMTNITQGTVLYLQFRTKSIGIVNKAAKAPIQVVCESYGSTAGKGVIAFSFSDGSTMLESELIQFSQDPGCVVAVIPSIEPQIEVPIQSPRALLGISLVAGYCGADVGIDYISSDGASITDDRMIGDWYYAASVSNGQEPSLSILTKTSASSMAIYSGPMVTFAGTGTGINRSLTVNTSQNPYPDLGTLYSDFTFWLYFGVRLTGTLRFKVRKVSKYTLSNAGFHIGVRGVIDTDMTKICTHGFGCHSIGDLIGRTADICNHDRGVPFDHTKMIIKCEELEVASNRMVVLQAPMVNEYLRQTTISQYKSDLSSFFDKMYGGFGSGHAKKVIIFTGAGQLGHDDYLGPVTQSKPISYAMYRKATKEWADSVGATYIDAALIQKKLIRSGKAIGTDFLMKNSSGYDSNHPNNYTHQLWFESIKVAAVRMFQ